MLLLLNGTTTSDEEDFKSFPKLEQKYQYLILLLSLSSNVITLLEGCLHICVALSVFHHTDP